MITAATPFPLWFGSGFLWTSAIHLSKSTSSSYGVHDNGGRVSYSDENQQALNDPLHVSVRHITRARFKKIKEALNGLILTQDIPSLAQRKMKA